MREQTNCTCKGYSFIHRSGGGKCLGKEGGPFCGSCGEPASPKSMDFGIGHYEYCGATGVHSDVQVVSSCCEADLFEDASLKTEFQ
jgi:hypothetical protein